MRISLLLLAPLAFGQVQLRFTPEPMAVPVSVLANARDMGRWTVIGCNGPTPRTIQTEQIDMAAGQLRLISQESAMLVLTGHQKRSTAAKIVRVLSLAGQGIAIGVSVAGTVRNPIATMAIGVGSALLPQVVTIVQAEVPSIVPLQAGIKYPLTLAPGQCFTDWRFAAKMPNPQVVLGVID